MNARYRYALHLKKHGAHRFKMHDALALAFDYDRTKTACGYETWNQREGQRKVHAHGDDHRRIDRGQLLSFRRTLLACWLFAARVNYC